MLSKSQIGLILGLIMANMVHTFPATEDPSLVVSTKQAIKETTQPQTDLSVINTNQNNSTIYSFYLK